jgi:very-short-patch-repair endonuclease
MKKIKDQLKEIDWKDIQEKHNNGKRLYELGISRKVINSAVREGLFIKFKIPLIMSDDTKRRISAARKKWLSENPELHPWRKNSKFISKPCEALKEYLRKAGICFEEEVIVSTEKNYSVDILIRDKNLILEINGNQHYDKEGRLLPYYQERHDHIKEIGWNIYELHYTLAYNFELCLSIINNIKYASEILPYTKKVKQNKAKYGDMITANMMRKKEYDEINIKKIPSVITSGILFSKSGWVNDVAKIIGIRHQKVKKWMLRYMPEFYLKECKKYGEEK